MPRMPSALTRDTRLGFSVKMGRMALAACSGVSVWSSASAGALGAGATITGVVSRSGNSRGINSAKANINPKIRIFLSISSGIFNPVTFSLCQKLFCFQQSVKTGACFFVFKGSVNGSRQIWKVMFLFKPSLNHYFVSESRNFPKITLQKFWKQGALKCSCSFKQ